MTLEDSAAITRWQEAVLRRKKFWASYPADKTDMAASAAELLEAQDAMAAAGLAVEAFYPMGHVTEG